MLVSTWILRKEEMLRQALWARRLYQNSAEAWSTVLFPFLPRLNEMARKLLCCSAVTCVRWGNCGGESGPRASVFCFPLCHPRAACLWASCFISPCASLPCLLHELWGHGHCEHAPAPAAVVSVGLAQAGELALVAACRGWQHPGWFGAWARQLGRRHGLGVPGSRQPWGQGLRPSFQMYLF